MMHEDTVARLRYKAGFTDYPDSLYDEAADVIEELSRRVEDYEARFELSPEAEYAIGKYAEGLIDRLDQLIQEIKGSHETTGAKGTWEERIVEDADPFLRRRFYCSACGDWQTYGKTDFCPNCGADMKPELPEEGEHET